MKIGAAVAVAAAASDAVEDFVAAVEKIIDGLTVAAAVWFNFVDAIDIVAVIRNLYWPNFGSEHSDFAWDFDFEYYFDLPKDLNYFDY